MGWTGGNKLAEQQSPFRRQLLLSPLGVEEELAVEGDAGVSLYQVFFLAHCSSI